VIESSVSLPLRLQCLIHSLASCTPRRGARDACSHRPPGCPLQMLLIAAPSPVDDLLFQDLQFATCFRLGSLPGVHLRRAGVGRGQRIQTVNGVFFSYGALAAMVLGNSREAESSLRKLDTISAGEGVWMRSGLSLLLRLGGFGRGQHREGREPCGAKSAPGGRSRNPATDLFSRLSPPWSRWPAGIGRRRLHLAKARELGASVGRASKATRLFVEAYVSLEDGNEQLAIRTLGRGFRLARESGLYHPWL